jgi:hypothetical protein
MEAGEAKRLPVCAERLRARASDRFGCASVVVWKGGQGAACERADMEDGGALQVWADHLEGSSRLVMRKPPGESVF